MPKGTPKQGTKRAPRTLEERIAELQAQQEARKAKTVDRDRKVFDTTVEKYERALGQVEKFATALIDLHSEHGFELPATLTPADDQSTGAPVITDVVADEQPQQD